jgi:hypothetical protein
MNMKTNTKEREVRGLVEGMRWGDELDDKYEGERVRRMVHNQALDDLLSALKEWGAKGGRPRKQKEAHESL